LNRAVSEPTVEEQIGGPILESLESFFATVGPVPAWKEALVRRLATELDLWNPTGLSAPIVARFLEVMNDLDSDVVADPLSLGYGTEIR